MQGEPGVDYNDSNLNPLVCDLCKMKFNSLDKENGNESCPKCGVVMSTYNKESYYFS